MLFFYNLRVAWRAWRKQKAFAMINILGLSVGLVSAMAIFLYVWEEWKFDRHHVHADRIYRVLAEEKSEGNTAFFTGIAGNFGPSAESDFPEIEKATRIINPSYITTWVYQKQKAFRQQFCVADPSILEIFDLPLVQGDAATALSTPEAVVITETAARKIFGSKNPIGESLEIEGFWAGKYLITGVLRDIPSNSSIQFDILSGHIKALFDSWEVSDWRPVETYLQLGPGIQASETEKRIEAWISNYVSNENPNTSYHLQPLKRIYLYSAVDYGLNGLGDIRQLRLLGWIGLFIILIALFNFVNLATAKATERAREVGIRKVNGAGRWQLMLQFLSESFLLTCISMVLAISILQLLLPFINGLLDKNLQLFGDHQTATLLFVLVATFLIALSAGAYPAFILSSFQPVKALTKKASITRIRLPFRKLLVVLQFTIGSVLLISTGTIYQQWQFLNQHKWGFNKDEVVVLPLFQVDPQAMYSENWLGFRQQAVKNTFLQHPMVLAASVSHVIPPLSIPTQITLPGGTKTQPMQYIYADKDFLDTYEIELIAGRNFEKELLSQAVIPGILINETAAKQLPWEDPVGQQIVWEGTGNTMTIMGVLKDFLNKDLSQPVQPLFLTQMSQPPQFLSLRLNMENFGEVLPHLEKSWNQFLPTRPFEFQFANAQVQQLYREDRRMGQIIGLASALGIFIACLGLFGLASFMADRRVKEIGIRKVLGASVSSIVSLMSKDFLKLVVLALLLATPLAYYFMDNWLQSFSYRIPMPWAWFAIASLLLLAIALITVSFQSIKSALSNPIESLRSE